VPKSANLPLSSAGTYELWAVYSGDTNNAGSTSTCGSETVIVSMNTTSTGTQVKKASDDSNVADGASVPNPTVVYDTASLTGKTADAGGTVSYYYKLQTGGTPDCTGGTQIGSAVTVSSGSVPKSANLPLSSAGTYELWAVYSGDTNNAGSTSACGSETVIVLPAGCTQTYTTTFLQPLDGSSPSKLLGNTMKSGRVVPVKATIYDNCNQSYVTDPTKTVTVVVKDGGTGTLASNDAVEVYADAGAANSNTLNFRWTSDSSSPGGGFWIYNLDSRTAINNSAMVVGHNYNVDIFVGSVRATATQWAILVPTK
jgi:hypothetical protein